MNNTHPKMVQQHTPPKSPKLLNQVRERLRVKHYSIRTEQVYVDWIKRFIWVHDKRHPKNMGAAEIEAFLTHLAVKGRVSASTAGGAPVWVDLAPHLDALAKRLVVGYRNRRRRIGPLEIERDEC